MSTIVGLCKWFRLVVDSPPNYYVSSIDTNFSAGIYTSIVRKYVPSKSKFNVDSNLEKVK